MCRRQHGGRRREYPPLEVLFFVESRLFSSTSALSLHLPPCFQVYSSKKHISKQFNTPELQISVWWYCPYSRKKKTQNTTSPKKRPALVTAWPTVWIQIPWSLVLGGWRKARHCNQWLDYYCQSQGKNISSALADVFSVSCFLGLMPGVLASGKVLPGNKSQGKLQLHIFFRWSPSASGLLVK